MELPVYVSIVSWVLMGAVIVTAGQATQWTKSSNGRMVPYQPRHRRPGMRQHFHIPHLITSGSHHRTLPAIPDITENRTIVTSQNGKDRWHIADGTSQAMGIMGLTPNLYAVNSRRRRVSYLTGSAVPKPGRRRGTNQSPNDIPPPNCDYARALDIRHNRPGYSAGGCRCLVCPVLGLSGDTRWTLPMDYERYGANNGPGNVRAKGSTKSAKR